MTPRPPPPLPPDPTCARCSKPVRSGGFLLSPTGEVLHILCRSRELQLEGLGASDRARIAIELAEALVEETTRRRQRAQPRRQVMPLQVCPVCREPATLTDWRPTIDWLAVENCACRGYFVWTPLLDAGRLVRLTAEDREVLSSRLSALRTTRSEAWVTTRDGTVTGALIIRSERPDRPT